MIVEFLDQEIELWVAGAVLAIYILGVYTGAKITLSSLKKQD